MQVLGESTPVASECGTQAIISFSGASQLADKSSAFGAACASSRMAQASGAFVSPKTQLKQSAKRQGSQASSWSKLQEPKMDRLLPHPP
jgi:hypothetical protein